MKYGRHAFGGYTEHRYGPRGNRPVYRPGGAPRIVHGDRETAMVERIKERLKHWRSSRFENEGAMRAGLRTALCLAGFEWQLSDDESARLIARAFHELGYQRPTWAQGQPDYVEAVESCRNCRGPLDDIQIARRDRFCSGECAKIYISGRDGSWTWNSSLDNQSAQILAKMAVREVRTCRHCSKPFQARSAREVTPYCSRECSQASQRMIPDRSCDNPGCGKTFRPEKPSGRYCSVKCRSDHAMAKELRIEKRCALCGGPFFSPAPHALYCGAHCNAVVKRYRGGATPRRLGSDAFDYFIRVPVEATRPKWLSPTRFDELVGM